MKDKEQELLTGQEMMDVFRRLKNEKSSYTDEPVSGAEEDEALCEAQIAKLKSLGYIKLPEGIEEKIVNLLRIPLAICDRLDGRYQSFLHEAANEILSLIRGDGGERRLKMNCKKIDTCKKIEMVLDKDLLDYAEIIRKVCERCKDNERYHS